MNLGVREMKLMPCYSHVLLQKLRQGYKFDEFVLLTSVLPGDTS